MAEEKKEEKKAEAAEEKAEAKEEKTEETPQNDAAGQEEVEVPKEFKKLVETIEKMTVLELSELVKVLEDKFGVSAAAPVAVAGAAPAAAEEEDDGGVVNVELTEGGGNKIGVIKALRGVVQDLGLKEAKEMVEGAPVVVKEGVEKEEAGEIKKQLEEAGAKVSFK